MANYVYTMNRVGKIVPPKRQILKDISLSFFPGAKIGVLGLNGSGKSTLLKIMAGIDTDIQGEAVPMPGLNIGYLPQEPQLDPEKTVRQEVESGLGEVFEAQAKLEAVYAAYADEDADFDALATEQARLEAIISTSDGGNLNLQLEMAADALRLPPWDATIGVLSGGEKRRVALCKLLLSKPDMLLLDEPTNHLDAESVDWLEQFLLRFPGTVVAITHDRYFLDNAAEWILELDRGQRHSMERQLLDLAGPETSPPEAGRVDGIGAPEGAAEGIGMVAPEPESAPGQVESPPGPLQRAVRARIPETQRDAGDLHSRGRAPGQ